ncbi:MAG: hypothetical protein U0414_33835 [Polyangiaceae bacterium]
MAKVFAKVAAVLTFGAAIAVTASVAHADGDVKEADATCYTATAILVPGDGNNEELLWGLIHKVVDGRWTQVSDAPSNRVGEIALTRFDVKYRYQGGPSYVYTVQCGHGGTCNDVAHKFREAYPQIQPAPQVHCGDLSYFFGNPTHGR